MKKFSARAVASILGVCVQRIHAKIKQGHFPGADRCECGKSFLIPESDLDQQPPKRISGNGKKTSSSISRKSINVGSTSRRR